MRTARILLLITVVAATACGRSESNRITLESGKVTRVEGCHVRMNHTTIRGDDRFLALNYACDVPESALSEKAWWGDKPEPLGFTMDVGDCLLLDKTFYCVEDIEPDKASLKATYKWATRHDDRLQRIR